MSAILPLFLLAVVVILLAVMIWRRPHPKHLFSLSLHWN